MERKRLKLAAPTNETKIKPIHEEINKELGKETHDTNTETMLKLWKEECNREEVKSLER